MATDLPHLLLTVLPFALASMVSPLTIIIVMAVLSATKRRALKAVLFAITYATVFSAICLLLVAVIALFDILMFAVASLSFRKIIE